MRLEGTPTIYSPMRQFVLDCGHAWLSRIPYPKVGEWVWCRRCDCGKLITTDAGKVSEPDRSSRVQGEPTGFDTEPDCPLDFQ